VTSTTTPGLAPLADARLLIGAEWVDQTTAGTVDHVYPGNGRVQAQVSIGGVDEIDAAVAAAQAALPEWRAMPGHQRRRLLSRLEERIEEHAEELTHLVVREMGAAYLFAQWNPAMAASWFGYYAGWADKIEGSVIPPCPATGFDYTLAEPYGVVGIITPWNGPLISIGMKVAPALAAGNTIVLKPSELAPFSSVRFAELALDAGIPPGVINVVPGTAEAGERLVRHPDVGKVSFTGGIQTAQKVIVAASETIKPLTLELGGKSANILMPDADLSIGLMQAVMMGCVALAGQGCGLGTRLLVADQIHDQVVEGVTQMLAALPVGDPLGPNTVVGPVVTESSCDRILEMIGRAQSSGHARLICGGTRMGGDLAEGFFVEPTVFDDVAPDCEIAQTEVFGPVLSILRFSDEDEAIRIANGTPYGLAAYLSSQDVNTVHRMASRLKAGTVWVNGFSALPPGTPFGGYGQSGYGREGGKAGLDEFLQVKNVFIGMPS
jgi:aldehyde dehydrogenase (NAD+)